MKTAMAFASSQLAKYGGSRKFGMALVGSGKSLEDLISALGQGEVMPTSESMLDIRRHYDSHLRLCKVAGVKQAPKHHHALHLFDRIRVVKSDRQSLTTEAISLMLVVHLPAPRVSARCNRKHVARSNETTTTTTKPTMATIALTTTTTITATTTSFTTTTTSTHRCHNHRLHQ